MSRGKIPVVCGRCGVMLYANRYDEVAKCPRCRYLNSREDWEEVDIEEEY